MTDFLVSEQSVCEIPGFNPQEDMLVIALPEDQNGGLDHALSFRRIPARPDKQPTLEIGLKHIASGAEFRVHLPGVTDLSPDDIAVLSLCDADQLTPPPPPESAVTLSGEGLYPSETLAGSLTRAPTGADSQIAPRKRAFAHNHNWHLDGPPTVRFFDLSNPDSELSVTLSDDTGGPIYAIRLTDTQRGDADRPEIHRSIVLAQTAPGTPLLTSSLLGQWAINRLGSVRFRAIAWIWLGRESHTTDPATGARTPSGQINRSPQLAIHGRVAGSIAIKR